MWDPEDRRGEGRETIGQDTFQSSNQRNNERKKRCMRYSIKVQLKGPDMKTIPHSPKNNLSLSACHKKYNTTEPHITKGVRGCTWVHLSKKEFLKILILWYSFISTLEYAFSSFILQEIILKTIRKLIELSLATKMTSM